jgi:hypothetical protein
MSDQQADLAVLTRFELYFAVRQFTRTMRRFAEVLDYDYDLIMIFFVAVEACFQSIMPLAGSDLSRNDLEKAYTDSLSLGTTLLAIGEASGIPRETVRRKVKTLVDMGYLAFLPRNKNVYVPMSALLDRKIVSAFSDYSSDINQLFKSLKFYSKT